MPILIIVITILLLAVVVLAVALKEAKKYGTKPTEELVGMCNFTFGREEKRQANLDKIMALFGGGLVLTNIEIRKSLNVSSRTVVRYMDKLEKDNKVIQVGKVGYTVTYKIRP